MTLCSRVLPVKMLVRRRRQLAFVICVIVSLSLLSSLEYLITAAVLGHWTPEIHGDNPVVVAATPESLDRAAGGGLRRTLGMIMPSIDYVAFKELEARQAEPADREVIRIAREAMTSPVDRLKIRTPRKTAQAAIVDKILSNKTGGFFVECGAFDGETASNTVYLEQTRKWSGLLIEMDPAFYTQLIGKRRRAWTINACLSSRQTVVEMKFFESNGQLGRLSVDNSTVRRRQPPNSALCFALESLLLALNRTHVDYFSLDVEGFELDILRSLPFDRLDIDVVSAEYLHAREPVAEYERLMNEHGYQLYASVNNMDYVFAKRHLVNSSTKKPLANAKLESRTKPPARVPSQPQTRPTNKAVENENIIYH